MSHVTGEIILRQEQYSHISSYQSHNEQKCSGFVVTSANNKSG